MPDYCSESEPDSDEEAEKKKQVPVWAQTPNLMRALHEQYERDPDQIFGRVKPCSLEGVLFKLSLCIIHQQKSLLDPRSPTSSVRGRVQATGTEQTS